MPSIVDYYHEANKILDDIRTTKVAEMDKIRERAMYSSSRIRDLYELDKIEAKFRQLGCKVFSESFREDATIDRYTFKNDGLFVSGDVDLHQDGYIFESCEVLLTWEDLENAIKKETEEKNREALTNPSVQLGGKE